MRISIKSLLKKFWKLWLGYGLVGYGIGLMYNGHIIMSIVFLILGIILIVVDTIKKALEEIE